MQVEHNLRSVAAALRRLKGKLPEARRQALIACGTQVQSWAQQDFRLKSRGQVGGDGIKWKPLAASTLKARRKGRGPGPIAAIGINTGNLFNSFKVGIGPGDAVTVGVHANYAGYFDAQRPIFPGSGYPADRLKTLEDLAAAFLEELIRNGVK